MSSNWDTFKRMVSIKYTKMTVPTWKTCTVGRKRAFHKKYAKVAFYVTTKLESNYDLKAKAITYE